MPVMYKFSKFSVVKKEIRKLDGTIFSENILIYAKSFQKILECIFEFCEKCEKGINEEFYLIPSRFKTIESCKKNLKSVIFLLSFQYQHL